MRYEELSHEELPQYKYPNLIAEIMESGYSICTIAEHMGMEGRRSQEDTEVWEKIIGKEPIYAQEAFGLSRLFNVNMEYLFCHTLNIFQQQTAAYWRWYKKNEKMRKEYEMQKTLNDIEKELSEKPYLLDFMKTAATWNEKQIEQVLQYLQKVIDKNEKK